MNSELASQITQRLTDEPNLITLDLAQELNVLEGTIIANLPSSQVVLVNGSNAQAILEELPSWGELTTIVTKEESIFEFKGNFPKAIVQRGYYNLNLGPVADSSIQFSGHFKLENIDSVAFVSRPFRGKESYCLAFIGKSTDVVFKVYLGRDEQRRLFPHQIEAFKQLAERLAK